MVEDGKNVSLEYTLTLDDGTRVDTNVGGEPLVYLHGEKQILPALESALSGMEVDETKQVSLSPEEGYGVSDPEALRRVALEAVPEPLREVGGALAVSDQQGNSIPVTIKEIGKEEILLDFNHPLVDQNLHFEVRVLAID